MMTAEKVKWAEYALHQVQQQLIRSRFSTVHMRYEPGVEITNNIPTIYYANHSSKWDHHIGSLITQRIWGQDTYIMISQKMMNAYPILKKAGCFIINNSDPISVVKTLDYTRSLLTEAPNRAVWIFPQGDFRANDIRPLGFQPGLAQLVRTFNVVRLVPVSFRFEFLKNGKPEAFVNFGKSIIFTRDIKTNTRALTQQLESTLCADLDALRADVVEDRKDSFSDVFSSKGIFVNRLYLKSQQMLWVISQNTKPFLSRWLKFGN
jgi:1-acyl-sn-glycerol-3-phosphate acyltransferase